MTTNSDPIIIVGAGLVGCLMSLYLRRSGFNVTIYERNSDPRTASRNQRPSLGITLCERGLHALAEAGVQREVQRITTPAFGRTIHRMDRSKIFQPYGPSLQAIYSVSRHNLNIVLLTAAIQSGVTVEFDSSCVDLDEKNAAVTVEHNCRKVKTRAAFIIAADGINSRTRTILTERGILRSSRKRWTNGYKELSIVAAKAVCDLESRSLHLWPRQSQMAIAFPNHDGSFTCAVHMPLSGPASMGSLYSPRLLRAHFLQYYPDLLYCLPSLEQDWFYQRPNTMETVKCQPWSVDGKILLIGDAAHAVLPSYGQGANAGFEDCRVLDSLIRRFAPDLRTVCRTFEDGRRHDTDALAELCEQHFSELSSRVADETFQLRRQIELRLQEMFPLRFSSLYSMITFSDMSYRRAIELDREHDMLIERLAEIPGIVDFSRREELRQIADRMLPLPPSLTTPRCSGNALPADKVDIS